MWMRLVKYLRGCWHCWQLMKKVRMEKFKLKGKYVVVLLDKIGEIETLNLKIRSEMWELLGNYSSDEQSKLSSQIKELQVLIISDKIKLSFNIL